MAFPNILFPRIPLNTEVSDEEFRLFHTIDRMLVQKLVRILGGNPDDAINVVAFLMWLERDKLSVNAVYKVLVDWPTHLVDMVADQVVALLEWLKNPTLVWEMRGDISLIQELCKENLSFVQLHQRRLEILQGNREIVTEMSERAFRNAFLQDRNLLDIRGSANGPRELVNRNNNGVQFRRASSGYVYGPRELEINGGVEFAAGPVYGPRGLVNRNNNGVQFGNGGSAGGCTNEPSSSTNGQILPNVPFGPRMRYVDTNGQTQRSEVNTQRPITEHELSFLLRGLNIQEEETDVHEDDRTVFLTFSRGYPITEPEIWGYFTRKFGNFIKRIHFEEVGEGEQALYARMVVRNTSILPLICDVHVRTKYVINGKHVWAKKYVRRNIY